MPKPEEVCIISVNGGHFRDWKAVEVYRGTDVADQGAAGIARVQISEVGDTLHGWANLKIKPGDRATVTLAGQLAVSGYVMERQVAYDARHHGVMITVRNLLDDAYNGAMETKPGQYKNYTAIQLARAAMKPYGIQVIDQTSKAAAKQKFERTQVFHGESSFAFTQRHTFIAGCFLHGDANGNLVIRDSPGPVIAELQEGRNILAARVVISNEYAYSRVSTSSHNFSNDNHWGSDARDIFATADNPSFDRHKPLIQAMQNLGNRQLAISNTNHLLGVSNGGRITANIVVQGWLDDSGALWVNRVGSQVQVYSPMLFPTDSETLGIRSVTSRQDDRRGTTTELDLCNPEAMSTLPSTSAGPADYSSSGSGAKPEQESN